MAAPIYRGGPPFQNTYRRYKNSVVGPIVGSGAPTDAVTGAAVAGKGSFYIDYAAGAWYYNSGTKASPVWSAFGSTAGAATPTSVVSSGRIVSTSPTAGVGYATGAGGAVTQATDKSTAVTLNTATGAITMNNASLADATNVSFTVTDSAVAATDVVVVNHKSGGTLGVYQVEAHTIAAGSFKIMVRNVSGGALGEALVLNFAIIKGVAA